MLAQRYTGRLTGAPLVYLSVSIDERNATRHLLHVCRVAGVAGWVWCCAVQHNFRRLQLEPSGGRNIQL